MPQAPKEKSQNLKFKWQRKFFSGGDGKGKAANSEEFFLHLCRRIVRNADFMFRFISWDLEFETLPELLGVTILCIKY